MASAPDATGKLLFASESATAGCPDKLCDRVADAVVDATLEKDPDARVSCEACTKSGMVMILGEIISKASVDYEQVIREAVKAVGYDSQDKGLDWRSTNVIIAVEEQAGDLSQVMGSSSEELSVGVACGYATDETPELLPLSHMLAAALCQRLDKVSQDETIAWAYPSGTAQVVVEYSTGPGGALTPTRVHSVVMSVQHAASAKPNQMHEDLMEHVVKPVLPANLCNESTIYRLDQARPAGSSSVGFSGRRTDGDSYGGWGFHCTAALSGKDSSKVSRAATYGARWAARSLVSSQLCRRAAVQLTYAGGSAEPVAIGVDSYGTAKRPDSELVEVLKRSFDFKTASLQRELALKSSTMQFQKLSAYGHMGRTDLELPWEKDKELK